MNILDGKYQSIYLNSDEVELAEENGIIRVINN
jgi:hypothetical protein